MAQQTDTTSPELLFGSLIDRWNERDPEGFASLFADDGHSIGFDGSEMHGREEIAGTLRRIFGDHQTARYVFAIRDVRALSPDVAVVRAAVGMVPPGGADINPAVNAVQSIVAVRTADGWRIAQLQNTPAQYHGRPDEAERLTTELRDLL